MQFEIPKESSNNSIIKVIGVGGGGSNAVNHMFQQGINGVDFIICNTDQQALEKSLIPNKVQLGSSLTQGLGAGSLPEIGKDSAIESIDTIKEMLSNNARMVFVTAGMGGGTGTGAAPIIAAAAKELGILTVGIVTIPFSFEGKKRKLQAEEGLEELRKNVDTMVIINNDKLREIYGNLSMRDAFAKADNVLTTAAKGIAEVITVPGYVNVDFNDVKTVMTNGGTAIMGYAIAEGEDRAIKAVEQALASPLLNDNNIKGASQVLLYITSGAKEVTMDEVGEISDYIQEEAGATANIIFGLSFDESLGDNIRAIVIATGFNQKKDFGVDSFQKQERKVFNLNETPVVVKVETPVAEEKNTFESQSQQEEPKKDEMYVKTISKIESKEEQVSFEFVVPKQLEQPEQKIVHVLDSQNRESTEKKEETPKAVEETPKKAEETIKKVEASEVKQDNFSDKPTAEEQIAKARERFNRLKEMNFKTVVRPDSIVGLENEPAYRRRNVQLENLPHSSESSISRFTLSENEEKKTDIRPNNSFLHDNVD
ncbi:MAG: cell division protein FtsZ [Bacteroidetes bacterium]|nr:cell division protein FtsZ [Bacteroidota bacterium]